MPKKLVRQKSDNFQNLKSIPSLSADPQHYPDTTLGNPNDPDYFVNSYRRKMTEVIADSTATPQKGGWYAAECTNAGMGTPNGREDENIYAVFFTLDNHDQPIVSSSTKAAAPCPPFCTDDGP